MYKVLSVFGGNSELRELPSLALARECATMLWARAGNRGVAVFADGKLLYRLTRGRPCT